jgi:hypothetical protein
MSKKALTTRLKPGRKKTHGGFSFLATGRLPEHRRYVEIYLTAAREAMIKDLGPTETDLSAAQIILIDRAISKIGILRCIEEHVREEGVMSGKLLAPSLRASYLGYSNSLRLDLQTLGIDKRKADEALDLGKYISEHYPDKDKKAKDEGSQEEKGKGDE